MAETVQGNFTFTVLDEDNSLYIIKGSNPMYLLHFEMLGLYVYASTESIMKNTLRKVNMLSFPYTRIETVHGDIIKIDSNGIVTRSEFEGKEDFRYASWLKYYDDFEIITTNSNSSFWKCAVAMVLMKMMLSCSSTMATVPMKLRICFVIILSLLIQSGQ